MSNIFVDAVVKFIAAETGLAPDAVAAAVEVPKEPTFGDFAFPCFTLAKERRMAPPKIAADIAARFTPNELLSSANPVGPYINFFANSARLASETLTAISAAGNKYGAAPRRNETVVIDFGSPNIAKPQGVHHILSTVLGNAIAHLHEHLGYDVVRLNYLGDWGTNHGKLIVAFSKWGDEAALKEDAVKHMLDLYVRFSAEAATDPSLDEEARTWFRKLEAGDDEAVRIWTAYREATRHTYEEVYARLGIRYDSYKGEASYQPVLKQTIDLLEKSGIAKESDGALIVDMEQYGYPVFMIRKSDGTSTYGTRDVAAALDRYETYHFARNIYVTQAGQQHSHFNGLFKTLELLGYEWANRCIFVGFGIMSFANSMSVTPLKMSTRHGNIYLLSELLDMAEEKVLGIINELNPDLPDKQNVARMVGVGAVIFANIQNERTRDVEFDINNAVKLDGDTSTYIQYNHARIASILRKAGAAVDAASIDATALDTPHERQLLLMMQRFPDVVNSACEQYKPNLLARYLLDLTKTFVGFYHAHHVLTAEPSIRDARLALLSSLKIVIATGMGLLGIEVPEEM